MVIRQTRQSFGRVKVKVDIPRTQVGLGSIQIKGDSPTSIVLDMNQATASQIYHSLAKYFNTEGKK